MPRDLFGDVTRPSISIGNRKWYTVPLSLISHSVIVFAVVVIPLLATDVLPKPWQKINVVIPVAPTPPSPPPAPQPVNPQVRVQNPDAAPLVAPDKIVPEPSFDLEFQNAQPPGVVGGVDTIDQVIGDPPRVEVAPPPRPVPVGGVIRRPQKLRDVPPVYPQIAQLARVEGIVIVEATIGVDGRVMDARVLRSVQMLDNAALDAVRQWEFTPTLLNGVPVPVIMTVTVQFRLTK